MPHWLVSGLIVVGAMLCSIATVAGQDKPVNLDDAVALITVYAQVDPDLPTEVKVAQGSGFLVDPHQGIIITAKHIVDAKRAEYGGKRRYMVSLGGHSGQVQAQKFGECGDGSIDICVLTIQAADVRQAGVEAVFQTLCVAPAVDDQIMGMGFPPGEFSVVTRVRGYITGPRAQEQKYPSDIDIVGGMSGGPVLRDGYVIALNAGGLEVNPNLTFVQALAHGLSLLQNAGVVCPTAQPKPPVTLSDAAGEPAPESPPTSDMVADTGPLESNTVGGTMAMNAFGSAPSVAAPSCAEPEMTASFSNVFGPDTEPAVYQMQRTVKPSENCRIATYKLSMSGNAPVERLTVDQSADDSSIVLDYAVWSAADEPKKVKFDIAMVQRDAMSAVSTTTASLSVHGGQDTVIQTGLSGFESSSGGELSAASVAPSDAGVDMGQGDVGYHAGGTIIGSSNSMIVTPIDDGGIWADIPTSDRQCLNQVVTVDKAVPPLGGQVQSASFSQRVVADPGCQILSISVSEGAPINHHILEDGASATLSYVVTSTEDEPGQLTALVVVEQFSPSTDILALDRPNIVLPSIMNDVEAAFDLQF